MMKPKHGDEINIVRGKHNGSDMQPGQLSLTMVVAVRQIYLGLPKLHACAHNMIVANIALRLERQCHQVGVWSDEQVSAALDYLADAGQIQFVVTEQFAPARGSHCEPQLVA